MTRAKFFALPVFALTAVLSAPAHASSSQEAAAATVAEAEAAVEAMNEGWNIVQNATSSPEHKTFVKAIANANLTAKLSGTGPFTVFAPTDQAFGAIPQQMIDYLMNPVNKPVLAQVVSYHVVPGSITAEQLYKKIEAGGGKTTLTTVEGQSLTFTEVQGNIKVEGTQGSSGYITEADVSQSNGVVHVVNGVLVPVLKPVKAQVRAEATAETADAAASDTGAEAASTDAPTS